MGSQPQPRRVQVSCAYAQGTDSRSVALCKGRVTALCLMSGPPQLRKRSRPSHPSVSCPADPPAAASAASSLTKWSQPSSPRAPRGPGAPRALPSRTRPARPTESPRPPPGRGPRRPSTGPATFVSRGEGLGAASQLAGREIAPHTPPTCFVPRSFLPRRIPALFAPADADALRPPPVAARDAERQPRAGPPAPRHRRRRGAAPAGGQEEGPRAAAARLHRQRGGARDLASLLDPCCAPSWLQGRGGRARDLGHDAVRSICMQAVLIECN